MKTGKIIFWSLVGVAAVGGGILIYNKYGKTDKPKEDEFKPNTSGPAEVPAGDINATNLRGDSFPLSVGSRGDNVAKLQVTMKKLGVDPGGVDGVFGNGTLAAVRKIFQKNDKVNVTAQDYKNLELALQRRGIPQVVKDIYGKFN